MVRNGTNVVALDVPPSSGLTIECPACKAVQHFEVRDSEQQRMSRSELEQLAGLLDGTSAFYATPPGPESDIGRCEHCGSRPVTITIVG